MTADQQTRQQAFHRSEGITPAEKYLKKLCDKSFLSLWSYSGIYRDQGQTSSQRVGKEVCDLLVVFENHIVIFSDKYCEVPRTGNLDLDWSRWFRKAVQDSARQVWGAERWIRTHPDRLYLDRECTQRFPVPMPDVSKAQFHRVVVAHGASRRCQEFFGGSGSFMIDSTIVGDDHFTPSSSRYHPFSIGQIDPNIANLRDL